MNIPQTASELIARDLRLLLARSRDVICFPWRPPALVHENYREFLTLLERTGLPGPTSCTTVDENDDPFLLLEWQFRGRGHYGVTLEEFSNPYTGSMELVIFEPWGMHEYRF